MGRDRGPGQIAGVVALAPGDAPGALDLNKLFIEPRHIRSGVGRALLVPAIAEVRRRGAGRLTILADPNAAAFYEWNGAMRIGEAPSDAVPGRLLPLYEVRLNSTGDPPAGTCRSFHKDIIRIAQDWVTVRGFPPGPPGSIRVGMRALGLIFK